MTVAAVAASQVASRARVPRSATLGALVLMAGGALVYWSLFRSRNGQGLFGLGSAATSGGSLLEDAARGAGITRTMTPLPKPLGGSQAPRRGGGGSARTQ